MKWVAIALTSSLVVTPAAAASFDCTKASTAVENMICDDNELSKLDEHLSELYKKALRDRKDRQTLRQSQRDWMTTRNECKDRQCIQRVYVERSNALDEELNEGRGQAQNRFKYQLVVGGGQPLCEGFLGRMNAAMKRLKPGGALCGYDVLQSVPGVTFPHWKRLDIRNNKALYERFVLANLVRADAYPEVFRKTSDSNFIIQMPTKGQMTPGREAFDTEPGRQMDGKVLESAWKEATVYGTELYELDGAFSGGDKHDVLLIEMSTVDRYHSNDSCPHFRFARFSADLGHPKPLHATAPSWTTLPMGLPFEYAGKRLTFRETLSDQPRLSNGVDVLIPGGGWLCQIQGNVYFPAQ